MEKHGASVFLYDGKGPVTDKFFRDEKTDVPDAAALSAWLKDLPKPIALFCCNDLRAVQVMKICADLGLNVPRTLPSWALTTMSFSARLRTRPSPAS